METDSLANSFPLDKEIADSHPLSTGRSAPHCFTYESFDYNLAKFLGLATYSGAEIGECYTTVHSIEDGNVESWIMAWATTARRVEGIARGCLEGKRLVSAREAFLRAATYYQAAFFYASDRDPRKRQLFERHYACFESAGALFDPPFEAVRIPYEGRTLPGFFLRCDGSGLRRPTVLIQSGGDGTAVQLYFSGGGRAAQFPACLHRRVFLATFRSHKLEKEQHIPSLHRR